MLGLVVLTNDVSIDKSSEHLVCVDFQAQRPRVSMERWGSARHVLMEADHSVEASGKDA